MIKNRCLIIFIKYPEKGTVKSRLARHFGEEFAAGLYENFIFDLLTTLQTIDCQLYLYFYPPEKEAELKSLFGDNYIFRAQQGADLGDRMSDAFTRSFAEGIASVVLIGSDLPDLPRRIIEDAFTALEDRDAVIGPAVDGGYYLIGLKKNTFTPDIFRGLDWSTSSVLARTKNKFEACDGRLKFLEEWHDIDTGADLLSLIARSQKSDFVHSRTMAFLKKRGLMPD